MIWIIRFLLECILTYPLWVMIVDMVITIFIFVIFFIGVVKAIRQGKKGGIPSVKKQPDKFVS